MYLSKSYLGRTWYKSSSDLLFSSKNACVLSSTKSSRLFAYSSMRERRLSKNLSPVLSLKTKQFIMLSKFKTWLFFFFFFLQKTLGYFDLSIFLLCSFFNTMFRCNCFTYLNEDITWGTCIYCSNLPSQTCCFLLDGRKRWSRFRVFIPANSH